MAFPHSREAVNDPAPTGRTLHWCIHSPSPYNDSLFNALADSGDIDLRVLYWNARTGKHHWKRESERRFRHSYARRAGGVDWSVLRRAAASGGCWVFAGWTEPTVHLAAQMLRLRRTPYAVWTDTPQMTRPRNVGKRLARGVMLHSLFSGAKAVMGTGRPALEALQRMGAAPERLLNLPYFVDTDRFVPGERQRTEANADKLVFLSSGRLFNAHKGFDLVIPALARLREQRPDLPFVWRVAGSGPDEDALRVMAGEYGLSDRIEWLGWVEAGDLPAFYRSGDVFLFPSRIEPYGVAALEAMSTGLPVIGSASASVVLDRLEHGVNGLVHAEGDWQSLAGQLPLVCDAQARLRMGRCARATAEDWPLSRAVGIVRQLLTMFGR